MPCLPCTQKSGSSVEKQFDLFWPTRMPFPPIAPWVATFFSRSALKRQYLQKRSSQATPPPNPGNTGIQFTTPQIDLTGFGKPNVVGGWAINIDIANKDDHSSIIRQLENALPNISDTTDYNTMLATLETKLLTMKDIARIEIVAHDGVFDVTIYQTQQLQMIDPTLIVIPNPTIRGGDVRSETGGTSTGEIPDSSQGTTQNTGGYSSDPDYFGKEESWNPEGNYDSYPDTQRPWEDSDNSDPNQDFTKPPSSKDNSEESSEENLPEAEIIDPCRYMPFGCYGIINKIYDMIDSVFYGYNSYYEYNNYKYHNMNQFW